MDSDGLGVTTETTMQLIRAGWLFDGVADSAGAAGDGWLTAGEAVGARTGR